MERCLIMREERVTINILNWLERNEWKIICYDFPQSGTGVLLHPNSDENRTSKNKEGIIPDIIAVKNSTALYFENKDRYYASDFEKIREIKTKKNYSKSLDAILSSFNITEILYGIGLPSEEKHVNRGMENIEGIDFLVSTSESGVIAVVYDIQNIFGN